MENRKLEVNRRSIEKSQLYQQLVTISDKQSVDAEQFRVIRTNIDFALGERTGNAILVTSATAGEGKSTNAANLAVVFAQEGKRVLLVDADMRKPSLHLFFATDCMNGLSTILTNGLQWAEVVQDTPVVGLSMLASGAVPTNPSELLSSKGMAVLLSELKQAFDVVIVDAPPILAVTDALILARRCDGVLLVVQAGVANKVLVQKAQVLLQQAQANILGVVLNRYKMSERMKKIFSYKE